MEKKVLYTEEGFAKLKEEYEYLKSLVDSYGEKTK